MALTIAAATVISAIIGALSSVGITLGTLGYSEAEMRRLEDKVNKQKVTASDISQLISKISDKATVLGTSKLGVFQSKLNRIINNYSISSGESEAVLRPIRARLESLNSQLSKLKTSAELHSTNAEQSMNAYNAFSDKQKAQTYEKNPKYKRLVELKKRRLTHGLNARERQELKQLEAEKPSEYTGNYLDTAAGRTLKTATEEAEAAARDYSQIAKLSEENM